MIYLRTEDREVFLAFESGQRRDAESKWRRVWGLRRGAERKRRRRMMCNECVPLAELL